jgi:hypothetical protein
MLVSFSTCIPSFCCVFRDDYFSIRINNSG